MTLERYILHTSYESTRLSVAMLSTVNNTCTHTYTLSNNNTDFDPQNGYFVNVNVWHFTLKRICAPTVARVSVWWSVV